MDLADNASFFLRLSPHTTILKRLRVVLRTKRYKDGMTRPTDEVVVCLIRGSGVKGVCWIDNEQI